MAQDYGDIRSKLVNFIDELLSVSAESDEATGVPEEDELVQKNIIPTPGGTFDRSGRVNPIPSNNERRRTYNFGLEIAAAFWDYQKRKQSDTSKPSTLLASSKKQVDSNKLREDGPKIDKKKMGFLGKVLVLLAGTMLAASLVWDAFGGVGAWVMKTLLKLPKLIETFHLGLKGFFKGYAQFADNIAKWFDEGLKGAKAGAKGISKIAGNFKGVLLKMAQTFGLRILKALKFLPFIGSLASFVFAYKRFKEGQFVRGTLELVSGILNLVPGAGWVASALIDGSLLVYDLMEAKSGQAGAASAAAKTVKYGLKFIPVLLKTAGKIGTKLLKVLKWLPVVGGFAGMALAYMRFKEGEWFAGTLELVSAIADFIPGPGTVISWIIDGALLTWDLLKAPKGEKKEVKGNTSGSFWDTLKSTAADIGRKVAKVIRWVPFFGNLWSIGEGIASFMNGDWGKGTRQIIQGLLIFLPPVLSDPLFDGLDWLLSLFSSKEEKPGDIKPKSSKSFGQRVKEFVKQRLKSLPWFLRKPLEWLGILSDESGSKVISSQSKTKWAENISNAFNNMGDDIVSGVRDFSTATKDVVDHAAKEMGKSVKGIADSYMQKMDISDTSELPSQLLREQYEQLNQQGEFTGNFEEYREKVLSEDIKKFQESIERQRVIQKGLDALIKAKGQDAIRDVDYKRLTESLKKEYHLREDLQKKALERMSNAAKEADIMVRRAAETSTVIEGTLSTTGPAVGTAAKSVSNLEEVRAAGERADSLWDQIRAIDEQINDLESRRIPGAVKDNAVMVLQEQKAELEARLNEKPAVVMPIVREVTDKVTEPVTPVTSPVVREVTDKVAKPAPPVAPVVREVTDKVTSPAPPVAPVVREVTDKVTRSIETGTTDEDKKPTDPLKIAMQQINNAIEASSIALPKEMKKLINEDVIGGLENITSTLKQVTPTTPATDQASKTKQVTVMGGGIMSAIPITLTLPNLSAVARETGIINQQPSEDKKTPLQSLEPVTVTTVAKSVVERAQSNKDLKAQEIFRSDMLSTSASQIHSMEELTRTAKDIKQLFITPESGVPAEEIPSREVKPTAASIPPPVPIEKPVDPTDILVEQNKLIINSNQLLFEIVNANKQQLGEMKKEKPAQVVQAPAASQGGGFGAKGTFGALKTGGKGSYAQSPYTLGTSPSITI